MIKSLSEHQRTALERYYWLIANHPGLFSGREHRPIVLEPAILEEYAREHQAILGVACETQYLWLINDLVQSRAGSGITLHPYLRLIAPPQAAGGPGVVVIASLGTPETPSGQRIVLVEQERHATGSVELELPRGFGEPGMSPAGQALRELRQETGYTGAEATYLGTTLTDSGTTDGSASFFHVQVTGRVDEQPEAHEAISGTVLLSREELWRRIDSGAVRDSFTVQALALYERRIAKDRSA